MPVFDFKRRELRFYQDWVKESALQGSREVGIRNRGDRESLGRSTDWVLQVSTREWDQPRNQVICTNGHILSEEGGATGIVDQTRRFILIAVPVNWNPPTRELAILIGEEEHRSCLVSLIITEVAQFSDALITALPA